MTYFLIDLMILTCISLVQVYVARHFWSSQQQPAALAPSPHWPATSLFNMKHLSYSKCMLQNFLFNVAREKKVIDASHCGDAVNDSLAWRFVCSNLIQASQG